MDEQLTGLIFDIQGHSVHDGPGCRTLVFLSGCPLRCGWCANPEGQMLRPRVMVRERHCVPMCQSCVDACPHAAAHRDAGRLVFDRLICNHCSTLDCVVACLHGALTLAGRPVTLGELLRVLRRDQSYWGRGGGVTFSGGEPFVQAGFLLASLKACRASYMHTAVETCAYVDPDLLHEALQWVDWLFVDLKHMDSAAHRAATGVGNELILHNIALVAAADWPGRLIVRVPVVPCFNDSVENLAATAAFVAALGLEEVNLLPFHRLGASKYEQLGLACPYAGVSEVDGEAMQGHRNVIEEVGLRCYVGYATPF